MEKLLEMCGFSTAELSTQLLRMRRACSKLDLSDADVRQGELRLAKYYAVDLVGVRKILRLCVLEALDSILAREEGKTYVFSGFMAPGFDAIGMAMINQSKAIFSAHQSWAILVVFGCIFDKIHPVYEAAEKKWLKAGMVAHCANVKAMLGSVALELIPKPDLAVTAGFMCETAPKTLDLLREVYGIPVACYDSCFDRHADVYGADNLRSIEMAAESLRTVVAEIQRMVGFDITDEMLMEVLAAKNKLDEAMAETDRLIVENDPRPYSATHGTLMMALHALTLGHERMTAAVDAVQTLNEELRERVARGIGAVAKGAPRVLAVLPGQHADPRFEHLVEEVGIAIVALDGELAVNVGEVDQDDPYIMIAMGLAHSLLTSMPKRIELIIDGCRRLKVDGLLDRYHIGCRTVVGDAFLIESAVKKELGLPVLAMEWENFDPRVFDYQDYKKRLEVFKDMMVK